MGYRISEEFTPEYQNIRTYRGVGPNVADRINQGTQQVIERGARQAKMWEDMFSEPVEKFYEAQDRQYQRAQAEEQMKSQVAARELAGLQKKKAEQEIALSEEFARPEREAQLAATRDAMESSRIERELAQGKFEALNEELPSGRTVLQESIISPIEAQKSQMELNERQLNIAERNAAANAETAKLQQQNLRMGIDDAERQRRVEDLQYQIAAESDPARRDLLIENLRQTASSKEIGRAIANVKSGEVQNRMMQLLMAQSDPVQQNLIRTSQEAQTQSRIINAQTQDLDQAIMDLERATPGSDEAESAAKRIATVLEQFGYTNESEAMGSRAQLELMKIADFENPIETRLQTAKEARNKLYRAQAARLELSLIHI